MARRRGRDGGPVSAVIGEFPRDHDLPVQPLETAAAAENDGGRGGGGREGGRVSLHAKKKGRKKERRNEKRLKERSKASAVWQLRAALSFNVQGSSNWRNIPGGGGKRAVVA